MPSGVKAFRHTFEGGLSTERGAPAEVEIGADGRIGMPFLLRAENIEYLLNGAVKKIKGLAKYNGTTLESGEQVRGMFEYVRQGTGGSPTRKKVCYVGTKVKKDDNDGTFTDIFTGRVNDSVPCFTVFEDVLIMSTDANEAPIKWDQTTATTLGGSPPNFAFSVGHANRLFAAGAFAFPSRLYYSSLLNAEEWGGTGNSGVIDVDPDDGDVITGLAVYRGQLLVFKGPNFGSIHRISGLTPDTFAREKIIPGVGAVWHNLIFPFGNDIGFVAPDGTIRTVVASDRFGDFEEGALSRDISQLIEERTNFDVLKRGWAATDSAKGIVAFTLPWDSSTQPNVTLVMDFRFDRPRFAIWSAVQAWSVARMTDPSLNDRRILYFGGNDGFLRKSQQSTHSIDGSTAISAYARTPFFFYGSAHRVKTLQALGLGISPRGEYTASIGFRRESGDSQVDVIQGGGDVLGEADENEFTLDTSTLAGDQYRTRWVEVVESGQFREISYEISNVNLNEDIEVHAIHAVIETSENVSYENDTA